MSEQKLLPVPLRRKIRDVVAERDRVRGVRRIVTLLRFHVPLYVNVTGPTPFHAAVFLKARKSYEKYGTVITNYVAHLLGCEWLAAEKALAGLSYPGGPLEWLENGDYGVRDRGAWSENTARWVDSL